MSVKIKESSFHGWNGYLMSAGDIAVGLAPEIGGRIISLKHRSIELMFVQKEQAGETFDFGDVTDLKAEKRIMGFGLWGGDKTWISPQSEWWEAVPPLELDAGKYSATVENNAVVMESGVCRETGLKITRRVELKDNGDIVLDQTVANESDSDARRGIWDVTQCLRPFDVYIPAPASALRPYPEEGDSEKLYAEAVDQEDGWARVSCCRYAHFKYGGLADRGVVVALRRLEKETLAFVRAFDTDKSKEYAHHSSVEVYNSPKYNYLEIEVHAPLVAIPPGGSVSHSQLWRVGRVSPSAKPADALKAMGFDE